MQTFLPYYDFARSAESLDRQRLGKQRVEVLQILKALQGSGGWSNHPATRMWSDYTSALVTYGVAVCDEWIHRGYKDTCREKILAFADPGGAVPPWIGDYDFHLAHRSNLVRKNPEHYLPIFGDTPSDLPYVWPI